MLRYSAAPGYRRREPVRRPKLDAFMGVIDRILAEDHSALGYQTPAAYLATRAASLELRMGSAQLPFRSMINRGDSQTTWP